MTKRKPSRFLGGGFIIMEINEILCPKCQGKGSTPMVRWTVKHTFKGDPFGCYENTGEDETCRCCGGSKKISVIERSKP
jgi:hypothetical protein